MADRAVILAAGMGTRMGGPKALMTVGDEPWWVHQQRRLEAVGLACSWVVSAGVRAAMVGRVGAPTRLIEADETGPMFATLVRGLGDCRRQPPTGVFVLPIDVPVARAGVWEALRAAACVAVPVCGGGRGHPIYLPWSWIEDVLMPVAGDPTARLDALVRQARVEVRVEDPACTMNLNTPGDLQRWLETSGSA